MTAGAEPHEAFIPEVKDYGVQFFRAPEILNPANSSAILRKATSDPAMLSAPDLSQPVVSVTLVRGLAACKPVLPALLV